MRLFYKCLMFLLFVIPLQTFAYSHNGILIETTPIWTPPSQSAELAGEIQQTPLWHYKGSEYWVWVDKDLRAMVSKITNGNVQTAPLDDNPDYKVQNDGHHRFSMGIDKNGFIHITGDMHNYTNGTTSPYITRYQKQGMLYWKSNKPEDVTGGFSFVGGKDSSTTMPGTGWTYGRFFTDNNGDLYYSSRVKAIQASHVSGEMGLGVYKYNVNEGTWTALGDKAEDTRPGTYWNVILWENSGMAPAKWYQGFMSDIKFDRFNRMHLVSTINSTNTLPGNDRIIYAVSNDGGNTWSKANGTKISKLPIRATDGVPNQGDIVAETKTEPFFDSRTKVVVDNEGRPAIAVGYQWYKWRGDKWVFEPDLKANTGDYDNNGHIYLTVSDSSKVLIMNMFHDRPTGYEFRGYTRYNCLDANSLKQTGVLYGLGTKDNIQSILKTTIKPAPLPLGWRHQSIHYNSNFVEGSVGFMDGKFTINGFGFAIDNTQDSLEFVYKPMTGNGSIVTRVVSNESSSGHTRAGIMMRESLAYNSRHIATLLAPNKTSAVFAVRNTTGGYTANTWINAITLPYWLKLERNDNVFTASISKDNVTWMTIGKTTINLPPTIYVGLASSSGNYNSMQNVVFDQINAPAME